MAHVILVREISSDNFGAYSEVSPEFIVTSVLECKVAAGGIGGILLREKPVTPPYRKCDYQRDESPPDWAKHYDLSTWGIFLADDDGRPVGGAAVAPPMPDMVTGRGRSDVAVLWGHLCRTFGQRAQYRDDVVEDLCRVGKEQRLRVSGHRNAERECARVPLLPEVRVRAGGDPSVRLRSLR